MKKKTDKWLFTAWVLFIPTFLVANFLVLILLEYGVIDVEMPFDGVIWLNSCSLLSLIYFAGWIINIIIDIASDIKTCIKKKKESKNDTTKHS